MDSIFVGWQIIKGFRPNRLKNNKTGKNLEIDYYIGKYCIGFEYQGQVHFKHIKKYSNNPDNSRYNDLLKVDMSINNEGKSKRKPLTIVEFFYTDLKGDFRENLINRISNSIDFYFNNKKCYSAINLVKLLCFIESGVKYKDKNMELIPEKFKNMLKEAQRIHVLINSRPDYIVNNFTKDFNF